MALRGLGLMTEDMKSLEEKRTSERFLIPDSAELWICMRAHKILKD